MTNRQEITGPLQGVHIVELGAIGPAPFCTMLLADMGAEILRIDPPKPVNAGQMPPDPEEEMMRGRCRLSLNLKDEQQRQRLLDVLPYTDILIEGNRPGVLERLGIGPGVCHDINPRLIIGRMTGWGQDGPLANAPGHDPNYLALTGALFSMGYADRPPLAPLNLVGDFGGGALYLAMGLLAALLHARETGQGQVVDAAMIDGVTSMMSPVYAMRNLGMWKDQRGVNLLDGSCPFGTTYETADGKYVVVVALEPKFYRALLKALDLDQANLPQQFDQSGWAGLREKFASVFKTRTRDEWAQQLEGTDACVTPVLDPEEAQQHPHNLARGVFTGDRHLPAAAPRFSRTVTKHADEECGPAVEQLVRWGMNQSDAVRLTTPD